MVKWADVEEVLEDIRKADAEEYENQGKIEDAVLQMEMADVKHKIEHLKYEQQCSLNRERENRRTQYLDAEEARLIGMSVPEIIAHNLKRETEHRIQKSRIMRMVCKGSAFSGVVLSR